MQTKLLIINLSTQRFHDIALLVAGILFSLILALLPGARIVSAAPMGQDDMESIWPALTPDAQHDPESFLIGLTPEQLTPEGRDGLTAFLGEHNLELVRLWPELGIANVRLGGDVARAANADAGEISTQQLTVLENSQRFRFVEHDGLVFIADVPPDLEPNINDPLAPDQYALDAIYAREAWNITHGDPAITVAVIDTGYSPQHEDFNFSNLWRNPAEFGGLANIDDDANGFIDDIHGWNWVDSNNDPTDGNGHGTHILGTIAADTNNNTGVSGLGRSVRVSPLRIFGPSGSGRISDLVAAIDYAVNQEIPVINLSLTTSTDSPSLRQAVDRARQAGVLVIAASGNMPIGSSFTAVQYPAIYPSTLAVAATNNADNWAAFSRHGPAVDVAAPGAQILSLHLNNEYRSISGTSMATAHVSALAALILSLRPDLDAAGVTQLILNTADDVNAATLPGKDDFLGHGRINMAAALLEASRGLTIRADSFGISPAELVAAQSTGIAQTAELRVQVTAPGSPQGLPVRNAVVHYRVQAAPGAPENKWQRALTNAQGEAYISVSMDSTLVAVELQVGAVSRTVEATMLPTDTQLTLDIGNSNITAGSGPVSYSLRLAQADDTIISATVPVQIFVKRPKAMTPGGETDEVISATLDNGVLVGTFDPGTVSGTVVVSATAGPYQAVESLEVLPAQPYTITGPSLFFPEVSISTNSVLLEFIVQDRFGNGVADGTQVTLYAAQGMLASSTLETINGRAAVAIKLPTPQLQTVSVWAVAHAGPVEVRIDIPAVRIRMWAPMINSQVLLGND